MIAAVACKHVDQQLRAGRALHLAFPRAARLALEARRRQRRGRAAAVLRQVLERVHVRRDQLRFRVQLVRHLRAESRQVGVGRGRRRPAAGDEPAAVGVGRRDKAHSALCDRLRAVAAIEPQLVANDATTKVSRQVLKENQPVACLQSLCS